MSPDEIQHFNEMWQVWFAEGSQQGWMLDGRHAVQTEGRVVSADNIADGPCLEGNDVVRGYVNVHAETLDTAAELAKGCPVLRHAGRVEVRPLFEGHPGT